VEAATETPDRDGPPEKVSLRVILRDPAVRVVLLIIFVVMLGFGLIAPILPLYARSFGVSYGTASLLISAFAFARLIFDPVAGPMVDRFGERLSAVVGVMAVGVSALLAGLATSFPLVVLFRGAGGLGSSLFFAALYSYLLRVIPKDRMGRTMSVVYGTLNVGVIAGGPLGGVVAKLGGLRSPLFVYSGLCLLSGVLYLRYMTDPGAARPARRAKGTQPRPHAEPTGPRSIRARFSELLQVPGFFTVLILNMAFFWMVAGGYDTLVPLFAKEGLGMSEVGVSAMFTIAVAAEFIILYPAGSAADRIGRKPVLLVSLSALAVMTAVVGWAGSPLALGMIMALLGLASGATAASPSAMLADVTPAEGSGTAVGYFRFFGDLGFVLGPLTAGLATRVFGFKSAFVVMAVPIFLTLLLVARTPETLRTRAAQAAEAGEPGRRPRAVPLDEDVSRPS
jgi:MFS family permease